MQFQQAMLHNVAAIAPYASGWKLSRFAQTLLPALNQQAQMAAWATTGCEIRFRLQGEAAFVTLLRLPLVDAPPTGIAELYFGGFQGAYQHTPILIGPDPVRIKIQYPAQLTTMEQWARQHAMAFHPQVVRLILPYDAPTVLLAIEGDITPPAPHELPARQYLAYGSSITHGGSAVRPTETFAMQTAQNLGYDLINLGCAGSAFLEPEVATAIAADYQWQVATLELGSNVFERWSVDDFAQHVQTFITRAARHPKRLVICLGLFTSFYAIQDPQKVQAYQQAVQQVVAHLHHPQVKYVDGRDLLPDPENLTADLLHPSASGMTQIAQRLAVIIRRSLDEQPTHH